MAWATIPVPEGQKYAAAYPIRNEELFRMAERRSQRKAMKMAPSAPPAGKTPSTQTGSATRAAQGSGAKRSKPTTTWKPKPLPRPHPEDFVVIIKPREPVALRDVFQRGALGTAFATLVGVQKAATLNLLLSPEQNLIIASTREAQTADQLLGDFELQTDKGKMAAHGLPEATWRGRLLRCGHGRQPRATDTLRQALQCRAGELLDIRKFGTSNKAGLTFAGRVKPRYIHYNSEITFVQPYYETIPACGLCGTVGHRADSCPNPANAKCGLCGQQAELVEGVRTPYECNRKCAVCEGSHATNSRECTATYRQPKMTTPQQSGLPNSGKKTRHYAAFSRGGSRPFFFFLGFYMLKPVLIMRHALVEGSGLILTTWGSLTCTPPSTSHRSRCHHVEVTSRAKRRSSRPHRTARGTAASTERMREPVPGRTQ
ncbi:hypothetical protein HPB49_012937 [Dermacentor silvarum]|uniref:Uncharacterized protein n=1 Tax=Dermacentor silvarum TaxID=543639 RepID=A0ACB8CF63_DERSI|nr:hypothetical protein HPB49_012937 [Dermacentor silvarum]